MPVPTRFATLPIFVPHKDAPLKPYVWVLNKFTPRPAPSIRLNPLTILNADPAGIPNSIAIAPTSPKNVSGSENLPSLTILSYDSLTFSVAFVSKIQSDDNAARSIIL